MKTDADRFSSRYEIIQSPIKRADTFLLDKKTGNIWQSVVDKQGKNSWQSMFVQGGEAPLYESKINFQLFISGMMSADTFRLDINSGRVWRLVVDTKSKDLFWILERPDQNSRK